MCFSATASFVAAGTLGTIGLATVAKTKQKKALPIASIPLIFGIQQAIDGIVWISAGSPEIRMIAAYGYALLSQVFWPVFVPWAILSIEPLPNRRQILRVLALIGVVVGLFFLYYILIAPIDARIIHSCISYDTPHPYPLIALSFYVIAVCGSCLVSSRKVVRLFGIGLLLSFGIAGWFYIERFSSVWCFFAAVLSLLLHWHIETDPPA